MPKKRKYKRRSTKSAYGLKGGTIRALSAIAFLLFTILILLSFVSQAAALLSMHEALAQLLGVGFYLLPIVTLLTSLYLWKFKLGFATPRIIVGLFLFLVTSTTLIASFSEDAAGQIGVSFWNILAPLVTAPGAVVMSFLGMLAALFIIFSLSYQDVANIIAGLTTSISTAVQKWQEKRQQKALMPKPEIREEPKIQGGSFEAPKPAPVNGQQNGLGTAVVANVPMEGIVWEYPPLSILSDSISKKAERGDVKSNASIIERTLDSFGIQARVAEINLGPAVTQYALEIALGTKLSKITGLQNDLALALAAPTGAVRIEAPIPGKSLVGIEIPNKSLETVSMKSILSSDVMVNHKSKLAVALGFDISGQPVVADIAKMPHLLMAGTTGSGKSVAINTFICSLLFRCSPQELKLILIDPKRVEMVGYNGIPHLLTPVIVEVDKILAALTWATHEMDRRYKLFAQVGVRNIDAYNELSGFQALPYIVIFIDELADLMMFSPVEVEDAITRLAQMARATGIHMIVATQRPSVDVLTGLIKANIPARIAFNVSSMVDSRVILDQPGAEKLLGRGDMLYIPPESSKPTRIQGVFSDPDVKPLVEYLKQTGIQPEYAQEVTEMTYNTGGGRLGGSSGEKDALFDDALRTIIEYDQASASLLQRRLKVGYARAARLIDELEAAGVIGPPQGSKSREIKVRSAEEYFARQQQAAQ